MPANGGPGQHATLKAIRATGDAPSQNTDSRKLLPEQKPAGRERDNQ
jgi:hypothetical protein